MRQNIDKVRLIIKQKPYLMWSTRSYNNLSLQSMVEAILNYGNWQDFKQLKEILGINELASVFEQIIKNNRNNLRPQTVNYFKKYFNKYAQ